MTAPHLPVVHFKWRTNMELKWCKFGDNNRTEQKKNRTLQGEHSHMQVKISFEHLPLWNRACSPCCTFYEKKSLFSLKRHIQFYGHWKWTNFHQLIRIPTNSKITEMTDVLSSCGDRPKFRLRFFWYVEHADNFKIEWMKLVFLVLVNIEMFVKINSSFFD